MALVAGTRVGGYLIEGGLGRGGMATVYRARHVETGREVALKLIAEELGGDPRFVARFRREGRLQASLEHPHVVTVYEAGESEHGLYLALQLVPGAPLATLMHERALDADRAIALLAQVADALDAAHRCGLVHRDVKPQNVLVGKSDDAYLGDFGLSVGGARGVTAAGRLMGTVSYLAPEVIRGDEGGPASDRYAFAAVVFECLTGSVVYPRSSEAAILFAHTSEPPPRASRRRPELPRALDGVFEAALAKDPGERPASAAELVEHIAGALSRTPALGPPAPTGAAALEQPTVEPTTPRRAPATRRRRRRPVAWLAGIAFGAAAVAGVLVAASDSDSDAGAPPATLPGVRVLGSDLVEPGRARDCRGGRPRPSSPRCTIVQTALPGRELVVPEDGVIRRWGVRSARGELALTVVRPRGDATLQVARSPSEFASNDGLHLFPTDIAVERGDLVGLSVVAGSAAGVRAGVDGARTRRWIPRVGQGDPRDRGLAGELLLRVEYTPGGQQRLPAQTTGPAAAALTPGRIVARRRLRYRSGRPVEIAVVALGRRFALDEFVGGRRSARIAVPPDFRAGGGQIRKLEVLPQPSGEALGVYMEYARTDSARLVSHYYGVSPHGFEYVD